MATNLEGGAWSRISQGQRVEVAPFRDGGSFPAKVTGLDGSVGIVTGVRGVNAYVKLVRPEETMELPMKALKPVVKGA